MTDDNDPELEFSPLGGAVSRGGVSVHVYVYRVVGSSEGWALEVVAPEGTSTTWDELFVSERAALDEFESVVREHGLMEFLDEPEATVH